MAMSFGFPDWWKHLPTAELFGLAGHYRHLWRGNCAMGSAYRVGNSLVAVRLWRPAVPGPVHYLIDDDIRAGIADPSLPAGYRHRLEAALRDSVEERALERIVSVITPSARLAELYEAKGKPVIRLDPAWDVPAVADLSHFAELPLRVACLGTRSHLADFDLLREAVEDPARTWEFHHFLGEHAPGWLRQAGRVRAHPPLSWRAYRRNLRRLRFHLCLYPMLPTPFNLARSCNKVMEHAMVGAASVFSASVPFAGLAEAGDAAVLAKDGDWQPLLRELTANPARCKDLAGRGHRLGHDTATAARASPTRALVTHRTSLRSPASTPVHHRLCERAQHHKQQQSDDQDRRGGVFPVRLAHPFRSERILDHREKP